MPLILLGLLEVGLRLFGYGYATSFFRKSRVAGQAVWVENEKFARRYFPAGLVRVPQPVVMPVAKPAGVYRIFVFGESAALGDPAPAYGFSRILQVLLEAQYPQQRFEVVNVAVTAINSHVIRQIARDCADREGDLWILYMGNNEVVGPYGAGTVFGEQVPSMGVIRLNIALKATRVGQLLDELRQRFRAGSKAPSSWGGMEMFLEQQVRQDDPRMKVVYDHFRRNLEDVLLVARRSGIRVLVGSVVSNLKDCAPFASEHRLEAGPALDEFERLFRAGLEEEGSGKYQSAIAHFEEAARLDPSFAELQYHLGQCYLRLGRLEQARSCLVQARDQDTLRFRADTALNRILAGVSAGRESEGVVFVDLAQVCAEQSQAGLPGEELLYEHVHLNFQGNYVVARTLAQHVAGVLPARIVQSVTNPPPLLTMEECGRRLALSDWDRYGILKELRRRLEQPPFTQQSDRVKRDALLRLQMADVAKALEAAAPEAAIELYETALARWPNDWVLLEDYAQVLQELNQPIGAESAWRKVIELLPHRPEAYYSLGNSLDSRGQSVEALVYFKQALRLRPDSVEAHNGLGLALANLGRADEAIAQFEEAAALKPDFVEARINHGQLLAKLGRVQEAKRIYAEVLSRSSNSVAAHVNLGKLLAQEGESVRAVACYREALRIDPNHAVAHFNLGNVLAAQNDPGAVGHYEAAVRAKPDFAQARYNLGLSLAREGRNQEALAQFSEVVRLQPEFGEAHLNFGVALAKEKRFAEAIEQFQAVIRLDPRNETAAKFLQQAQDRQKAGP